jgi:outer membrane lipoprotein SlyB
MANVSRVVVGLFAALLLAVAQPGAAQPGRAGTGALRVDAFDVEQVASLAPGTPLNFSVFATSGASATVLIDGVRRLIDLREVQPGVYEGTHTIGAGDRIRPESAAVATVWRDGAVARATLEESLVLDGAPPVPAAPPRGVTTEAEALPREMPPAPIAPPRNGIAVPAPFQAQAPRVATVPAPIQAPMAVPAPAAYGSVERARCGDCAVVESIRTVDVASGPAYLGAIAGGIAGAVFGDKIGEAHARHVTRFLGAVGGALLGHEIERSASRRTQYEATFRLPSGAQKVRRYDNPPPFRAGDTIRFEATGPRALT